MGVVKSQRFESLDGARGTLMILMALDHANYMIGKSVHYSGEFWGGLIPQPPSFLHFFIRFVSHFCAPGFLIFMSASMVLAEKATPKRRFIQRGLFLIALQFTLENLAWWLSDGKGPLPVYVGVLYMLGVQMILSTFLLQIPSIILWPLSLGVLGLSQFLVPQASQWSESFSLLQRFLFFPGPSNWAFVLYSVLPWTTLAILGILLGRYLKKKKDADFSFFGGLALALFLCLVATRLWGGSAFNLRDLPYSDGSLWKLLLVVKYPPSVSYMLLGLSGCFFFLYLYSFLEKVGLGQAFIIRGIKTFGKAALFFYILHLYLYALMSRILPTDRLEIVLLAWPLGIILLYPLCRKFIQFKSTTSQKSLWRLL